MIRQGAAKKQPRGGPADKRCAILAGALTVFARDGYTRASIDAISSAAGVSTRTIYNHFQDKTELFRTVIQESAVQAATAQTAVIDRYLREVTDLETALVDFARAWAALTADDADHYDLVRRLDADAGHLPAELVGAWQETGPLRVRRQLAIRFTELADRGLLRIEDADGAASHFLLLVSATGTSRPRPALSEKERDEFAVTGVRAFLHGYLGSAPR